MSPTIGLFFLSDDYLKFISNLRHYVKETLVFISPEETHYANKVKDFCDDFGNYPIGRLIDVDIHFLHYTSENEAREKWSRRCQRINWNKLIIKNSMQNLWSDEIAYKFDEINEPNKILFETKKFNLSSTTEIMFTDDIKYGFTRNEGETYRKYMNILKYINNALNKCEPLQTL